MIRPLLLLVLVSVLFSGCSTTTSPSGGGTTSVHSNRGSIAGFVEDYDTHEPIVSANVMISLTTTTISDSKGAFRFDSVPPGTYVVSASASGHTNGSVEVHVDSGVTSNITVMPRKTAPSTTLSLTVLDDRTNQTLSGALVEVGGVTAGTTGSDGMITYDLSGGDVSLTITLSGYARYVDIIHIPDGQTLYLTVRLQPTSGTSTGDTLLCLYRFSGNTTDSSGHMHNGTKHGCTYVTDRFNNPSSALQLNGTSDYLTVPDAADLNFGKNGSFSICFWSKYSFPQNQGSEVYVMRKGTGAGYSLTGYQVIVSNGYYFLGEFGTTYGAGNDQQEEIGGDTRWHFFVYTFDRSGTILFYYDGTLYDRTTLSGTAIQGNMDVSAPLLIGGDGTTAHAFKGILDDVRLYKGILSSTEINTLYHENNW